MLGVHPIILISINNINRIKFISKLEKLRTLNIISKYLIIAYFLKTLKKVLINKNTSRSLLYKNLKGEKLIRNLLFKFKIFISLLSFLLSF